MEPELEFNRKRRKLSGTTIRPKPKIVMNNGEHEIIQIIRRKTQEKIINIDSFKTRHMGT